MLEIERLHNMLADAGIEHQWIDRTPPHWKSFIESNAPELFLDISWGWQIRLNIEKPFFSAIEGYGSYGYGLRGESGDHIEIMIDNEVQGWLSAETVFDIIKEILCTK